jgi:hypothetical protein
MRVVHSAAYNQGLARQLGKSDCIYIIVDAGNNKGWRVSEDFLRNTRAGIPVHYCHSEGEAMVLEDTVRKHARPIILVIDGGVRT